MARNLLPRDLAGTICPDTVGQLAEHLKRCGACSIAYESAREAIAMMSGSEGGDPESGNSDGGPFARAATGAGAVCAQRGER